MHSYGYQFKILKLGKTRNREIKLISGFGCNHGYRFRTLASFSVPGVFSGNESGAIVEGADVYNLRLSHCRN